MEMLKYLVCLVVLIGSLDVQVSESRSPIYPKCGPVCAIFCPNGNVLDSRGCPTCQCKPSKPKCGPVCRIFCPNGNVLDEDGCPTCKCRTPTKCGPVCDIYCPNGNVLDKNGCPTCKCKPFKLCPLVLCARPCPNGVIVDENGCSTCRCKPVDNTYAKPLYEKRQNLKCQKGCARVMSKHGPICRCKTSPPKNEYA